MKMILEPNEREVLEYLQKNGDNDVIGLSREMNKDIGVVAGALHALEDARFVSSGFMHRHLNKKDCAEGCYFERMYHANKGD